MSEILETLRFLGSSWLSVAVAVDQRLEKQSARIAELEAALAKAADDLHYGAQKARTPSFATILFDAEKNARAALEGGKDE